MALLQRLHTNIRRCRKCRLWRGRSNAVPGEGPCPARIMFIGQAPGRNEDRTGRPFIGTAGRFLDRILEKYGIDRKGIFITSVVKCYPPGNRAPRRNEVNACNPYLREQIRIVNPKIIVLLGRIASEAVLGKISLDKEHGKPLEKEGIIHFPTYHPAAAMRFPRIRKRMDNDFRKLSRLFP